MKQNLVSVHFDTTQWSAVDGAITVLEQVWEPMLVVLGPDRRRHIIKMGDGSEPFVRSARRVAEDNPDLIPGNIDVAEMARDLDSHDALAARRTRLAKLFDKLDDTDVALGSDAMVAALQCYGQLKLAGRASGLDSLRRDLGRRFDKTSRKRVEEEEVVG